MAKRLRLCRGRTVSTARKRSCQLHTHVNPLSAPPSYACVCSEQEIRSRGAIRTSIAVPLTAFTSGDNVALEYAICVYSLDAVRDVVMLSQAGTQRAVVAARILADKIHASGKTTRVTVLAGARTGSAAGLIPQLTRVPACCRGVWDGSAACV